MAQQGPMTAYGGATSPGGWMNSPGMSTGVGSAMPMGTGSGAAPKPSSPGGGMGNPGMAGGMGMGLMSSPSSTGGINPYGNGMNNAVANPPKPNTTPGSVPMTAYSGSALAPNTGGGTNNLYFGSNQGAFQQPPTQPAQMSNQLRQAGQQQALPIPQGGGTGGASGLNMPNRQMF